MQLPPTILSIGNNKKAKAKAGKSASIAMTNSAGSKKEVTAKAEPEEPVRTTQAPELMRTSRKENKKVKERKPKLLSHYPRNSKH